MDHTLYTENGIKLREDQTIIPWNEHPRPLLARDRWLCLNGWWEFSVQDKGMPVDAGTDRIRVPFPPESALSGIRRHFPEGAVLRYRREVTLPREWGTDPSRHLILHIDAADQHAAVYIDGREIGRHDGGYEHFSFDITGVGEHFALTVETTDDLRDLREPYGKQTMRRGGMWYTPFSGIWQSVWLECVPETYVERITVRTDLHIAVIDTGDCRHQGEISVEGPRGSERFALRDGHAEVRPSEPRLWSPEDPYLYHFTLKLDSGDEISSYFALRTIGIEVSGGVRRLSLNGRPYFFHALLDQGYWSDGLCTPAGPASYEEDIRTAKLLGFNTLRKHIRVEPDLFYHACDRLGMVVFQDMVNNGDYSFLRDTILPNLGFVRRDDRRLHRDPETRARFLLRMDQTVAQLGSFPSILYWTIFNEGWGQFDSAAAYDHLHALDDTRIIDAASGWYDQGAGDVTSIHVYNHPYRFEPSSQPVVLSECGGYSRVTEGHVFASGKTYGYGAMKSDEALIARIERLYRREILPRIPRGLSGSVYTQLSDVEDEVNGVVTYDRRVVKLPAERMQRLAEEMSLRGEKA